MSEAKRKVRGRPGHGPTRVVTVRIPVGLFELVQAEASRAGYVCVSHYLMAVTCRALKVDTPPWVEGLESVGGGAR